MTARNTRRRRPQAPSQWGRYAISPQPLDGVEGLLVIPCPKDARRFEAVGRERRSDYMAHAQYSHILAAAFAEHQAHAEAQLHMAGHHHAHVQFFQEAADMMVMEEEMQGLPQLMEASDSEDEDHVNEWII